MSNLARVEVNVLSKADPVPADLLRARAVAQQSNEIRDLFIKSKEGKHTARWLATRLSKLLKKHFPLDDTMEVASYLADEYQQVGDGVLLVSPKTGRAIARVTEDDFYTPAPVPRADGRMVERTTRLRPEVEAFITVWKFTEAREANLVSELSKRVHSTALLQEVGDRRLLPITKAGRATISEQLRESLPTLLENVSGSARDFLTFFDVQSERPEHNPHQVGEVPLVQGTSSVDEIIPVQDPKTFNLKYDRLTALRASVGRKWVRDIAANLASQVGTSNVSIRNHSCKTLTLEDLEGIRLWIASPDVCNVIKSIDRSAICMPVEGMPTIGIKEGAGTLVVHPEGYKLAFRELFERWHLLSTMTFTIWLDFTRVVAFNLSDIPTTGRDITVEVLL